MILRFDHIMYIMKEKTQILVVVLILSNILILTNIPDNYHHNTFSDWEKDFGLQYTSFHERIYRQYIYFKNLDMVRSHNQDHTKTYSMAINQFSALTQE